ncbi:SpoIIE family protein phosphatase [Savagea sp. SN6]|uniref:SpoIIE family protein phosphatase n=2 Tax=Savagea serpentis TaxID=2785297 RepID=A0A8J7G4E3_9BACL|nr:SpoIIE family protein phosphatase [Savagea serpentis]
MNRIKVGNRISGDVAYTHFTEEYAIFVIADGLGNGPEANESSRIVEEIVRNNPDESIEFWLLESNRRMVAKRGAAVGIIRVDFQTKQLTYCGVGNIRMYMLHNHEQMIYPLPVMGYLSGRKIKMNCQTYPYESGDTFYMHSDGVLAKSPKACLQQSPTAYDLAKQIESKIDSADDATFIAVQLL